jgi:hypothetical protein
MRIGFGKVDITPRVGVELAGFGPFRNRHSIAVRDRLWSRAMAVSCDDRIAVLVSNDLIQLRVPQVARVRELVGDATGLAPEQIMVHCTHTHSGPATGSLTGWGDPDCPYLEILPGRIARAACEAVGNLQEATLSHAEVPCEGIGLNREWDRDAPPLEEVLCEDWRPAKPELTDTTCQVLAAHDAAGRMLGFASYFGCHPVVCCAESRYISGDFVGVATNLLERENPGAVGLFLQGAQGDVNSCVVHKSEQESLLALDIIAARYARSVRHGLTQARPIPVDCLRWASHEVCFSRREVDATWVRARLAEQEAILWAPDASDSDQAVRMATVCARAFRGFLESLEQGERFDEPREIHGIRLGPLTILGGPFEIFQAIKNEVRSRVRTPLSMVLGLTNGQTGYAPDKKTAAAKSDGYTAYTVPLILGIMPFANIHEELANAFVAVADDLQ